MIWAMNRNVQRYRLTDRPLVSTHLWAAPWIQILRASHYSINKKIQLHNSKSQIWLYLFYTCVISWFTLFGNCDKSSDAIFLFPGIYSIYDPYYSRISLHWNILLVLKFSNIIFLWSVYNFKCNLNKYYKITSRFWLYQVINIMLLYTMFALLQVFRRGKQYIFHPG